MNRTFLALCLMATITAAAAAAPRDDFSTWTFNGGRTGRGTPVCGLMAVGKSDAVTRNAVLKRFGGKNFMSLTLYKEAWSIPRGTSIPVSIDFDDNQPLSLAAFGDGKVVDIQIPTEVTATFLSLLTSESLLRITFRKGNEATWEIDNAHVRPEMLKFIACARQLSSKPF